MSKHTEEDIPNSDKELQEYMDETLCLLNENTIKHLSENQNEVAI